MSDLLLRGRGANIGVRAPTFVLRLCGAALALGAFALADALGVWQVTGVPTWIVPLFALVAGALLAPTRYGSLLWIGMGSLSVLTAAVAYTPLVRPLAYAFLRADANPRDGVPIDAVVVLSGAITADGRLSGQALDRLLTAFTEARERHIGMLELSVTEQRRGQGTVNSEADQRALATLVAPELTLHFVHGVHSTRDEAVAFAALARTHQWHRVLVVTSPLHSRRACSAFETVGLTVTCRPAQSRDYALGALETRGNRMLAFQDVLYESAATVLYRFRGWTS